MGKMQQRSPEFRAVNPLSKVPALQASRTSGMPFLRLCFKPRNAAVAAVPAS